MKFRNIKIMNIIRKGLSLTLAVSMLGGLFPALPARAEEFTDYTIKITDAMIQEYNGAQIVKTNCGKSKDRIADMAIFLNKKKNDIQNTTYETDKVVWNPSQEKVDDNRDLYFLQWVNGKGYPHTGSYYEILARLVYITTSGQICYSKQVNIDDYPRSLLGLGLKEQWNDGVVNQCYFAVPEDCAQIVGLFFGNQSGGGNNNNTWWMDSLTISRITSDKISDITTPIKNTSGYKECSIKNGIPEAFVSARDIDAKYLSGYDTREEWLYLLATPDFDESADAVDLPTPTGGSYYAQIVTGEEGLAEDEELYLEVSYIDIGGTSRTSSVTINKSIVEDFYPEIAKIDHWGDGKFNDYYFYYTTKSLTPDYKTKAGYTFEYYKYLVNDIAYEKQRNEGAETGNELMKHIKKDGVLSDYRLDEDPTTITNLYGALLAGNFIPSAKFKEDTLRSKKAIDIPLNLSYPVKEVTSITLSMNKGSTNLQDVRIYMADNSAFTRTQMNGGMSTERVFGDVEDAYCLASLDTTNPVYLNGTHEVIYTVNPDSLQHQLLQPNKYLTFMDDDDNLGIQISLADVYDAGLDFLMSKLNTFSTKASENDFPSEPGVGNAATDHMVTMYDVRRVALFELQNSTYKTMSHDTAIELFNILENYYKEPLTLNITYKDDFGANRQVEIPFITTYLLQLYSDNNGVLGTNNFNHLTGIFQQGEDIALRVPLSQYSDIVDMTLTFGKAPDGVMHFRNNKWYFLEENHPVGMRGTYEGWMKYVVEKGGLSLQEVNRRLWPNETLMDGIRISPDENFVIRAIRLYDNVTKEEFHTSYDPNKRIVTLSTSRKNSDYYYAAKDKNGYTISYGSNLRLSPLDSTLKKGSVDYSKQDLKDLYLVEINGQSMWGDGLLKYTVAKDLYVTLAYTTTGGEEKKIQSRRLSSLSMDYNGKCDIGTVEDIDTGHEIQTYLDLRMGTACFILELDDVARFDYIYLSLPSGETQGFQPNSINVYELESLSKRYSSPLHHLGAPVFTRDFEGERVAFNNKPAALQPGKEGVTFYFTKINSDGTTEDPTIDNPHKEEYLTTPPTSMTYEETLKNLGLAINKYTYNVDVKVANVMDAGSSNYFYFQLVFENGTSGVVLANQQLTSDSFRQGYTESFTINTTQNFGNVTAVRVICDTSSSTSQAFDKLNIETITVTLPNKGSAKSWIVDRVGWIDINYQDEGVATTVNEDAKSAGFPNSQVVKEFAKTRTASTARLLFSIATAAETATAGAADKYQGTYDATLVYVDTAGYTQNYNFDLKAAIYNFNESESAINIFRPNTNDHFTLSINDIASVKALNIYRGNSDLSWTVKDVSISQFSDIGSLYRSTTGEFKRYMEDETLLTTSTNSDVKIEGSGSAAFAFADNSIIMDVANNDPSTWITTITRIPTTTQESLNVYLYAGSNDNRTYSFNTANLPSIKGRMEYTLKEDGSTIGSSSFTFNDYTSINGTTVLKAAGIKTSGMNQLKTLHLETSSGSSPIISGARVERVRENTIIETLYFDFANKAMEADLNYSAVAGKDTLSSATKQTVALHLTSGQQQLFTSTSDIAIAVKYTTESNAQESSKTLYTSPYVFFTDVGITSLGNTSILEVPFEVSGADQIVGISIVSTGPNVKFENAVVYNYVLNANEEKVMVDICQIAESFSTSTVEKQLMEDTNSNVTPVTFTFTTSADTQFPGAGTSGRLPLMLHYKTIDGKDRTLEYDNFAALLPAYTLPTAGSTVSFNVQLSNFSHLTSMDIGATDDDWHLNKVSAEIKKLNNALSTSYKVEAFVNQWITSKTSATAVFTGNDAQNSLNEIVSFSVTGKTSESGNVATATSGNVLAIKATPGETVTFTPQVTATGNPVNNVIWDTSNHASHMTDSGNVGLTFRVPDNSIGQVYSFTGYCSFDTQKSVTIAIQVVDNVPSTPGGGTTSDGTTGDGTTGDDTGTVEEAAVSPEIAIVTGNNRVPGPTLPLFTAEEGAEQTYTIFVKPGENVGTWKFDYETNSTDYTVTFDSTTLTVNNSSGGEVTMLCKKGNEELFRVTFKVIVSDLIMNITGTGEGITLPTNTTLSASNNSCIVTIPYNEAAKDYSLSLSVPTNSAVKDYATALFTANGNTLNFSNQNNGVSYERGTTIKTVYAQCAPINGTGYTLTVPITIKVADQTTIP